MRDKLFDDFHKILLEKYQRCSFQELIRLYKGFSEEFIEVAPSFNFDYQADFPQLKLMSVNTLFKGICYAATRDARGLPDIERSKTFYIAGDRSRTVILTNLMAMLLFTKLLLDKTQPSQKKEAYQAINQFILGAKPVFICECTLTSASLLFRMSMIDSIADIMSHPSFYKEEELNKAFQDIAITLLPDHTHDVFLDLMSQMTRSPIHGLRQHYFNLLSPLSNEQKITALSEFNTKTLPGMVRTLVSKPMKVLVDFVIDDKSIITSPEVRMQFCSRLLRNLEALSGSFVKRGKITALDAIIFNAVIQESIAATIRMKAFVKHDDVKWLETALLYDVSFASSPYMIRQSKRWNDFAQYFIWITAALPFLMGFVRISEETDPSIHFVVRQGIVHSFSAGAILLVARLLKSTEEDVLSIPMILTKTLKSEPCYVFEAQPEASDTAVAEMKPHVNEAEEEDDYVSCIDSDEDADDVPFYDALEYLPREDVLKAAYDMHHQLLKAYITSTMINASGYKTEIRDAMRAIESSKLPFDKNYFDIHTKEFKQDLYRVDFFKAHINIFVKYSHTDILKKCNEMIRKSNDDAVRDYWEAALKSNEHTAALNEWQAIIPYEKRKHLGAIGTPVRLSVASASASSSRSAALGARNQGMQ